ncbi:hypothetical protein FHW12_002615 [Dokdonella fugitiva]|uniref:Lysylphosphatidylglycerol synthase-like protein n=1 Tax=Dokdonella fugitiva TaxID=328517 RepID=A0A839F2W8_9GAMM|nr:hypothetical protein [Dokdonella fugitiva]MBA8888382.1 hypothetical protein [Dokdonella fugitiva]
MERDLSRGAPGGEPPAPARSRTWRVVAAILTLLAIAWAARLVAQALPDIAAHYDQIDPLRLLFALLLAVVASWFTFLAFARLLPALRVEGYRLRELAHLYFTAQLFKHLPGRIWGIGYQWMAGGRTASLGSWVQANVLHTLLATYFALWSSTIAIASFIRPLAGGAAFLVGALGCALLWSAPRLLMALPWIGPRARRRFGDDSLPVSAILPPEDKLHILLLFAVSWLACYASWYVNGMAYAPLGGAGGVRMCAYYMVAWFVGYVSLLTPSGLGVRELVFAWLAQDFPNDAIVLMAVVGRVSLLFVDLVLGLLFAPFAPRKRAGS